MRRDVGSWGSEERVTEEVEGERIVAMTVVWGRRRRRVVRPRPIPESRGHVLVEGSESVKCTDVQRIEMKVRLRHRI